VNRINHFISPITGSYYPDKIIGMHAIGEPQTEYGEAAAIPCKIMQWQACLAVRDGDKWVISEEKNGQSVDVFWQTLRKWVKGSKLTWAIGYNSLHILSLTEFWTRLSDKRWTILEDMPSSDDTLQQETRRSFDGFLVADDPPFICLCKPVGTPGVLKIVDMRNYGVSRMPMLEPGESMAASACDFLCKICELLCQSNMGSLKETAASQAMSCYRHSYLSQPILVHTNVSALRLERECLYAGRNECYRIGPVRGDIYHLDFNSFYPSIARGCQTPCRLSGHGRLDVAGINDKVKRGYCVIGDILICTNAPAYPYRLFGTTIYPIGAFRTSLCGPELRLAIQCGHVMDVVSAARYESDILFDMWVKDIHAARIDAENNDNYAAAQLFKAMNNSLYGKFAQQKRGWTNRPDVAAIVDYGQWWGKPIERKGDIGNDEQEKQGSDVPGATGGDEYIRWRSIGWSSQCESVPQESHNSCPVITAWLYSLARVKLLEAIGQAGWENVYYVDTDSLWINADGFSRLHMAGLIGQNEIGKLKIVARYSEVIFHGLKHYDTPTRSVHAGVPNDAEIIGPRYFEYRSTERLAAALQQGRAPRPVSIRRRISYSPAYRHGVTDEYGFVSPIKVYKGRAVNGQSEDTGNDSVSAE
jgi:DNA polymerase type B, organellar and viral